jgi:CYTH domain-containing protein
MKEIERKWLLANISEPVFKARLDELLKIEDKLTLSGSLIKQFYKGNTRYRVDRIVDGERKFTKTIKTGTGLVREEVETEITEEEFTSMYGGKDFPIESIAKKRYTLKHKNHTYTMFIDMFFYFHGRGFEDNALTILEIEFPTEKAAKAFTNEDLGHFLLLVKEEVTEDTKYNNFNLAKIL